MTRRALLLTLTLALVAPTPLAGQHGRFPRKILLAGAGGLLAGSVAMLYASLFEDDVGGCSAVSCVAPVTVGGGLLIGYMIGREVDQLYALRYRTAPPIRLRGRELPLSVTPNDVWYDAHTVFIPGEDALELVQADASLASLGLRARGLRGLGPIAADTLGNALFVGTPVGLYRFPLRGDTPGTLARTDEVSALAMDGRRIAVGTGPDLVVARVGDTLEAVGETLFESARVVDIQWAGDLLWVLTEDRLVAYRSTAGGASEIGAHEFAALARRFDVHGTLAAVATGSGGVVVLDLRDPTRPTPVATWGGARFVYDAVIRDSTVYVAGGPEGLFVLTLGPDGLAAKGLARDMGFVAALAADPTGLYLIDRTGGRLLRIPFGEQ